MKQKSYDFCFGGVSRLTVLCRYELKITTKGKVIYSNDSKTVGQWAPIAKFNYSFGTHDGKLQFVTGR